MIGNEMFHYIELQHKTSFLDTMWKIAGAIRSHQYIEIEYGKIKDRAVVKRKVQPLALLFSEYYFYLTAFITDLEVRKDFDVVNDSFPTLYTMDRIRKLKVLEEHFHIPYSSRFEEGEFRKRIQFVWREALDVEAARMDSGGLQGDFVTYRRKDNTIPGRIGFGLDDRRGRIQEEALHALHSFCLWRSY